MSGVALAQYVAQVTMYQARQWQYTTLAVEINHHLEMTVFINDECLMGIGMMLALCIKEATDSSVVTFHA